MSVAIDWTDRMDASVLEQRANGVSWHRVAANLQVGRNSVIERARRLGLQPATRMPAIPAPVVERIDRPPLPAGHPLTWWPITANTILAGQPYPYPVYF